jgi:hypothetical protein
MSNQTELARLRRAHLTPKIQRKIAKLERQITAQQNQAARNARSNVKRFGN